MSVAAKLAIKDCLRFLLNFNQEINIAGLANQVKIAPPKHTPNGPDINTPIESLHPDSVQYAFCVNEITNKLMLNIKIDFIINYFL
jgi:hypothetical protein